MIPKLKLGVGEMGLMFCDLHVSLNLSSCDINSMCLPCLTLVLPGNTSDSRNSSFFVVAPIVCEGRGGEGRGGSFCYLPWMRGLVALLLVFLLLCVMCMCVSLCFIVSSYCALDCSVIFVEVPGPEVIQLFRLSSTEHKISTAQ